MIERIYTDDLSGKYEYLIKQREELESIISELKGKLDTIKEYNNTFYSQSSHFYYDNISKELIKINEFLKTLNDCINFLAQVKNNYIELDNTVLSKLSEIGSVS